MSWKSRSYQKVLAAFIFLLCFGYGFGVTPNRAVAGAVCSNCLSTEKLAYTVGEKVRLHLKNIAPNSPILWNVQLNSTVLINGYEQGRTDAAGNYTFESGTITEEYIGAWTVSAESGNQQASISFIINPAPGDTKPTTTYLSKTQAAQGETITFYINGRNFNGASSFSGNGISPVSDRGFQLTNSKLISPFEIEATYSVSSTAQTGSRSITVTTSAGTSNAQEFTITPVAPAITSVNPSVASYGSTVKVSGSNFVADADVYVNFYRSGQTEYVYGVGGTRISDTQIEFNLEQSISRDLRPDNYDISVSMSARNSPYYYLESNKLPITVTGSVTEPPLPGVVLPVNSQDGEILQFNSEATLYLVKPDGLYPFESFYTFDLYSGQNNKGVRRISSPSGNFTVNYMTAGQYLGLPTGDGQPFVPGTLVNNRGTIFLIMVGKQIPFHNFRAFQGLGYSLNNVINADLSQHSLIQTQGIGSADVPHTWGSWVNYKGTIYYSDESGLIGVPSLDIFLSNRGMMKLVVPANRFDIAILQKNPNLPVLDYYDYRVEVSPYLAEVPPIYPTDYGSETSIITYDGSSFNPQMIVVNADSTVTFINESKGDFWLASDPHPTHTDYPELDSHQPIGPGQSFQFNFTKVGIWVAHDHLNPSAKVTIKVVEPLVNDSIRLADVRQMATALELYYNDNGKYPPNLSSLTPMYISQLPQAPTPPEDSCSSIQNTYTYAQLQNGSSYQLTFCLGSITGGLSPGVRTLTPNGIN